MTALVLSVAAVFALLEIHPGGFGVGVETQWWQRMCYHFVHASMFHALLNSWCLLCVAFLCDIPLQYIIIAYIIATLYPADTAHAMLCIGNPVVGMSGMCFALLGMVSWNSGSKVKYHIWVASFIAIGIVVPILLSLLLNRPTARLDNALHIYAYLCGIGAGYIYRLCQRHRGTK